jgi:hypothetical protein
MSLDSANLRPIMICYTMLMSFTLLLAVCSLHTGTDSSSMEIWNSLVLPLDLGPATNSACDILSITITVKYIRYMQKVYLSQEHYRYGNSIY